MYKGGMGRLMKKFIHDLKKYESKKSVLFIYFTIRILTLAAVIISVIRGNWDDCLSCVLALFLLLLPSVLERGLKVELPSALDMIIILMVYAAWVLGESESFLYPFSMVGHNAAYSEWFFMCSDWLCTF